MDETATSEEKKVVFEPLNVMGIFWLVFGVIVLFASFFIKESKLVPLLPSMVTNILAGSTLSCAGILCLLKAKKKRKLKENQH